MNTIAASVLPVCWGTESAVFDQRTEILVTGGDRWKDGWMNRKIDKERERDKERFSIIIIEGLRASPAWRARR